MEPFNIVHALVFLAGFSAAVCLMLYTRIFNQHTYLTRKEEYLREQKHRLRKLGNKLEEERREMQQVRFERFAAQCRQELAEERLNQILSDETSRAIRYHAGQLLAYLQPDADVYHVYRDRFKLQDAEAQEHTDE